MSVLGWFLSVDPFIQGTTSQAINPYSYIQNNPLSGTDPTGYQAQKECGDSCPQDSQPKDKDHDHRKGISTENSWVEVANYNGGSSQPVSGAKKPNSEVSSQGSEESRKVVKSITEEEVMSDKLGFIKNTTILDGKDALKTDKDVKNAVARLRKAKPKSTKKIIATKEQRLFAIRMKKLFKTLRQMNQSRNNRDEGRLELFLSVKQDENGLFIIIDSGLAPRGAEFVPIEGTEFTLHFHHQDVGMEPGPGDHSSTKIFDVPGLVISRGNKREYDKCCNIYEAGRVNNRYVYRRVINESKFGKWIEGNGWNKDEEQ